MNRILRLVSALVAFAALGVGAGASSAAASAGPVEGNALITSHSDGRVPRGSAMQLTFANCGRHAMAAVTMVTGATRTQSLVGYAQASVTGRVDLSLMVPLAAALGPAAVYVDCYSSAGIPQRGLAQFVVVERSPSNIVLVPGSEVVLPPYGGGLTPVWPGTTGTLAPFYLLPPAPLARSGLSGVSVVLLILAGVAIAVGTTMIVHGRDGRGRRLATGTR